MEGLGSVLKAVSAQKSDQCLRKFFQDARMNRFFSGLWLLSFLFSFFRFWPFFH